MEKTRVALLVSISDQSDRTNIWLMVSPAFTVAEKMKAAKGLLPRSSRTNIIEVLLRLFAYQLTLAFPCIRHDTILEAIETKKMLISPTKS